MTDKKVISKNIRFSEQNIHTLERVIQGMEARQKAVLPEFAFRTTQTDAIISSLLVMEKLLIQEGYLQESD